MMCCILLNFLIKQLCAVIFAGGVSTKNGKTYFLSSLLMNIEDIAFSLASIRVIDDTVDGDNEELNIIKLKTKFIHHLNQDIIIKNIFSEISLSLLSTINTFLFSLHPIFPCLQQTIQKYQKRFV